MIVISDSSALVCLTKIGQLDLLKRLYGEITIPEAVWREIVIDGAGQPGAVEVQKADWIKRGRVKNTSLVRALQRDLGGGESEAIALAVESSANLLIIDERLGRNTARHFGLNFTGLIGVLREAKHAGLISEVKRYLDEMCDAAGFRISDALYRKILADENE